MKKLNWRKVHRFIAPILFLPLLLTTITGVAYRLGRSWFDIPFSAGDVKFEYDGTNWVPLTGTKNVHLFITVV